MSPMKISRMQRQHSHGTVVNPVLALIIGMVVGILVSRSHDPTCIQNDNGALHEEQRQQLQGVVKHVQDLPMIPTAHKGVLKQQLLNAFSVHPRLAGVSLGVLEPPDGISGQEHSPPRVEAHRHATMGEFFYVLEGYGEFRTDERVQALKPGSFVYVGHRFNHSFASVAGPSARASPEPLKLLFFGITDD